MRVYIYGTGLIAKHISYYFRDDINIIGYIETCPTANNAEWGGEIVSVNDIADVEYDIIVIASSHDKEIRNELVMRGVKKEKILSIWIEEENDVVIDARLALLRTLAEEIKKREIEGAVAELGVYKGDFSKYINREFPNKSFYLFDTFEGFDEKDVNMDRNMESEGENIFAGNLKYTDIDSILAKMQYSERCIIKKGYFPDTAIGIKEQFCFVLIDVDLYQPILSGLEYFWDRMIKGGYILVHDYNSPKWKGAEMAVREFSRKYGVSYAPIPDMGGSVLFIK